MKTMTRNVLSYTVGKYKRMVQFEMCDEKGSYTEDIIFQIGDTIFVRGEDKKGTYYLSGTIKTIGSVILHLEFGKSVRLDEIYFVAKAGE